MKALIRKDVGDSGRDVWKVNTTLFFVENEILSYVKKQDFVCMAALCMLGNDMCV